MNVCPRCEHEFNYTCAFLPYFILTIILAAGVVLASIVAYLIDGYPFVIFVYLLSGSPAFVFFAFACSRYCNERHIIKYGKMYIATISGVGPYMEGRTCYVELSFNGTAIQISVHNWPNVEVGDQIRIMNDGGKRIIAEGDYFGGEFTIYQQGGNHTTIANNAAIVRSVERVKMFNHDTRSPYSYDWIVLLRSNTKSYRVLLKIPRSKQPNIQVGDKVHLTDMGRGYKPDVNYGTGEFKVISR